MIMSLTFEEPLSDVKKLDRPKSSVSISKSVFTNLLGECHGSSSPRSLVLDQLVHRRRPGVEKGF